MAVRFCSRGRRASGKRLNSLAGLRHHEDGTLKRARTCVFALVVLVAFVPAAFGATLPEKAISSPIVPWRSSSAPHALSNISDNPAYLGNFTLTAAFEAKMQGPDGGIIEMEDDPTKFENTDNTLEAIWIWSRYHTLTRDERYSANISAAWNYSWAHPAWLETDSGRVYSCSWAVKAELEFRRATGNHDNLPYAKRCAAYINARNGWETNIVLNNWGKNDIRGLAAGNLYDWAMEQGNETARLGAIALGNATKAAIEANSTWLAIEDWALAGGVAFWGVVHSTLREYPNATWAEQYAAFLKTNVTTPGGPPGNSQCGWYAWYALGHHAAWEATGNTTHLNQSLGMIAWLILQDGDRDGGIPTNFGEPDNTDESWVTSYRALDIGEIIPAWHGQAPDPPNLTSAYMTDFAIVYLNVSWNLSLQDSFIGDVVRYDIYRGTVYDAAGIGYALMGNVSAGDSGFSIPVPLIDTSSYFFYLVAVDSEWLTSSMSNQAGRVVEYSAGIFGHALLGSPLIRRDDGIVETMGYIPFDYLRAFDPSRLVSPWTSYLRVGNEKEYQSLINLPLGTGFWANVSAPFGVPMVGLVPIVVAIELRAGWNLVASCSMRNHSVADTLAGMPWTAVEVLDQSQLGYGLRRASPMEELFPGQGFWVYVTSDSTLMFSN
jgi:hypothetical protein